MFKWERKKIFLGYRVVREGDDAVVYAEYLTPHGRVREEVFRSRDHSEAIRYALNRSPNTILEGEFKIGKTIKVKGGVISGAKPLEFPKKTRLRTPKTGFSMHQNGGKRK